MWDFVRNREAVFVKIEKIESGLYLYTQYDIEDGSVFSYGWPDQPVGELFKTLKECSEARNKVRHMKVSPEEVAAAISLIILKQ